ncbi:probable protein S-acyltransferase 7 [Neltuma alba]|uniref:probable protein S-acyltransferase 7 n=1 Tax=Neltuma alba TaxID=207710 RepID=UPI0010A35226|nr:probable protein S-acyltransferase 7 [Prosopis alba]
MSAAQSPPAAVSYPVDAGDIHASSLVRTYRTWKGSNVFLLQGRLIFGPDAKSIFLTVFLVAAPVAVFCTFIARKLLDDFSYHLGVLIMVIVIVLTIFVLTVLLLTSGRDPGIIPRNAYPPEPDDSDFSDMINNGQSPRRRLPRTKDVIVNGRPVRTKYCDTCQLYRPPRCSHCSVCDNCVERFDHHCPWVGQCIGLRNYRFFYTFVFSSTLLCLYVHGFCWVYIKRIMDSEEKSIWRAMIKTPASIALIIYTFICIWFVGGLTVFHTYLISTNQTTYENFRYRYDRQDNPYNKGMLGNFKEVFCSSIPPSKNKFRSKVPKEPSAPSKRMGLGSVSPIMRKPSGHLDSGRPDYNNEAGNEESEYKDGSNKYEGLVTDSELSDRSQDLGRNLPTEVGKGQDASYAEHSTWERRSRRWDVSPEVGGSNGITGGGGVISTRAAI